jgi:hypothetical protein
VFPDDAGAFNFVYTRKEGDTENHSHEDVSAFEKDGLSVVMTPGTRTYASALSFTSIGAETETCSAVVDMPPGMDGELHRCVPYGVQ